MPRKQLIAAIVVLTVWCALAQEQQPSSKEDLIQGISRGDTGSIYEAGRTGDPSYLPALREQLRKPKDEYAVLAAQLVAAKLGDPTQLQAVFCEIEETAGVDTDGWRKLRYIRGGFSVRTLATLFDRDPEFGKILKMKKLVRQRGSTRGAMDDILFLMPSDVALVLLPEFVPNPPWKGGDSVHGSKEHQEQLRVWRDWINTHPEEIDKMQPNGQSVIFSKAGCPKRK